MKPIVLKKRFYINKSICCGVRDYQVTDALKKNSPLVVKYNNEVMTLNCFDLINNAIKCKKTFDSKLNAEQKYKVVFYPWLTDGKKKPVEQKSEQLMLAI
jgi:hypothetical protein